MVQKNLNDEISEISIQLNYWRGLYGDQLSAEALCSFNTIFTNLEEYLETGEVAKSFIAKGDRPFLLQFS